MRRSTPLLPLLLILAACTDSVPSTGPTTVRPMPVMRADLRVSATDLARAVAQQLRAPRGRTDLLEAMQASSYRDWKVSWNAFTNGAGSGLLRSGGGGGGGGGSPPPPPPGYFMTAWQIDQSYESWTAGSPEFEMVAWHWTGQWGTTANGGHIPILADNFFTCTSGDYPSTDPRDWYYNTPPDYNTAAQYGSSGIQILNGDEVYTFPPRPGYPILLVTENDDTPCIEGGFPTAWDPYFPDNNDELVGAAQLTTLNSVMNVPFTGDDDFDTNPGVHAVMSFVRR